MTKTNKSKPAVIDTTLTPEALEWIRLCRDLRRLDEAAFCRFIAETQAIVDGLAAEVAQ